MQLIDNQGFSCFGNIEFEVSSVNRFTLSPFRPPDMAA